MAGRGLTLSNSWIGLFGIYIPAEGTRKCKGVEQWNEYFIGFSSHEHGYQVYIFLVLLIIYYVQFKLLSLYGSLWNPLSVFSSQGSANKSLSSYGLWALGGFYVYKWLFLQCYNRTYISSWILPTEPKTLSIWPLKKTFADPWPRPFTHTHIHRGAGKFRFPGAALRISAWIRGMRGRGRELVLVIEWDTSGFSYSFQSPHLEEWSDLSRWQNWEIQIRLDSVPLSSSWEWTSHRQQNFLSALPIPWP